MDPELDSVPTTLKHQKMEQSPIKDDASTKLEEPYIGSVDLNQMDPDPYTTSTTSTISSKHQRMEQSPFKDDDPTKSEEPVDLNQMDPQTDSTSSTLTASPKHQSTDQSPIKYDDPTKLEEPLDLNQMDIQTDLILSTPTAFPKHERMDLRDDASTKSEEPYSGSVDLSQMDPELGQTSTTPSASFKHQTMDLIDDASTKSEEHYSGSMDLNQMDPKPESPVKDGTPTKSGEPDVTSSLNPNITHEPMMHSLSSKQLPPIQVMQRPEQVETNHRRIPSSVFTSKPSTPVDWSTASNDSCFSIAINNNTYARAQSNKSRDVIASGELTKSSELMSFRGHSSVLVEESETNSSNVDSSSRLDVSQSGLEESPKLVWWQIDVEHQSDEKAPPRGGHGESFPSTNHHHTKINNQVSARPKKKSRRCCSICTWPKWCSCKFPSCCSCKFPSCSSCKLPNCCWPSCGCCKWPNWSCNSFWASMCCLNCTPKKIHSSHPVEISAPARGLARENLDIEVELQKPPSKKWCCFIPRFRCAGSWSWSCRCC